MISAWTSRSIEVDTLLLHYQRSLVDLGVERADVLTRHPDEEELHRAGPSLNLCLVCEATHGRLRIDAAWPAIPTLDDPLFYLSGPPQMLAELTTQLQGRGIAPAAIRTDAWD